MNIAMFTNTYLPRVGGIAYSVARFAQGFRAMGHQVLVVAPSYKGHNHTDKEVVRIPAIQNSSSGSDFSVMLPLSIDLAPAVRKFMPDIIHSHHPLLIGNTALRTAAEYDVPLVFTHHSMYEQYTHYFPLEQNALQAYVQRVVTGYANLADAVVAPSRSVADVLVERDITTPVHVVPTGVDVAQYAGGDARRFRARYGIRHDAWIMGYVGRLAEEKNLPFLARATAKVAATHSNAHLVIVGSGPQDGVLRDTFRQEGVTDHLTMTGTLTGSDLTDAYAAMNIFVFASQSETQGMVLAEALAASCPIVALDGPGIRDIVCDGENGRLVENENEEEFAHACGDLITMPDKDFQDLRQRARRAAEQFDTSRCLAAMLDVYEQARNGYESTGAAREEEWSAMLRSLQREMDIWANRFRGLADMFTGHRHEPPHRIKDPAS